MHAFKRLVLAYRPGGAAGRPSDIRLRLGLYALLGLLAWWLPPGGTLVAAGFALRLGRGVDWLAWLRALSWFWLLILAPLLNLVLPELWRLIIFYSGIPLTIPAPLDWGDSAQWLPACWRSLTALVMLMLCQWLASSTTVFEIQLALRWLLKPLGRRLGGRVAFMAALTIGFVPWLLDEVQAVSAAAALRGAGRRGLPTRLAPFGPSLFARVFLKARHVAEAIELRGGVDGA